MLLHFLLETCCLDDNLMNIDIGYIVASGILGLCGGFCVVSQGTVTRQYRGLIQCICGTCLIFILKNVYIDSYGDWFEVLIVAGIYGFMYIRGVKFFLKHYRRY